MKDLINRLFYLDGIIFYPEEGMINSISFSLKKLKIEETDKDDLKSFIDPPFINSYFNHYHLKNKNKTKSVK